MGRILGVGGRLLAVVGIISTIRQATDFARQVNNPNSVMTTTGGFLDIRSLPVGTRIENWSHYPPLRGVISQTEDGHKYIHWDDLST